MYIRSYLTAVTVLNLFTSRIVICLSYLVLPTAPTVMGQVERTSGGGNVTIRVSWERPQNFDQFDIDRYDITLSSTSGIENMATACGECTNTTVIVSENPSNVQISTTFTITITARSRCNETGAIDIVSYTLSKFWLPLVASLVPRPLPDFISQLWN